MLRLLRTEECGFEPKRWISVNTEGISKEGRYLRVSVSRDASRSGHHPLHHKSGAAATLHTPFSSASVRRTNPCLAYAPVENPASPASFPDRSSDIVRRKLVYSPWSRRVSVGMSRVPPIEDRYALTRRAEETAEIM